MLMIHLEIDALSIVLSFKLYVSKLPAAAKKQDFFYCKPKVKFSRDDGEWYYNAPIGCNILASLLKEICSSAGLDCSNIQNHSLQLVLVVCFLMVYQKNK